MSNSIIPDEVYKDWLYQVKTKIQTSQIKAALAVNTTLINLYWDLGQMIVQKQHESNWGDGLINQLAKDLKAAFPEMKGFSVSNLKYCRQFYLFYSEPNPIRQQAVAQSPDEFSQQLVGQIPWGHHILIFSKLKDKQEALFYIQETIANNWSRNVLALQIKSNLHQRQGKAITNFERVLPQPQSDLAIQTLKDPYIFDFLTLDKKAREVEIENKLVQNITQFLLALGKGFAYLGKQYELRIAGKEYFLDLLFYHTKLHCYVVYL